MIKAFVFISAILVFICPAYEGLVCYHCYMDSKYEMNDYKMGRCNERNMSASETLVCPDKSSKCIYEVLESELKGPEIWRTCSNPKFEPCDPNSAPPGMKMLKCSFCETDRCNLQENTIENTLKISINANVSVSIG